MKRYLPLLASLAAAAATWLAYEGAASACGCLSPPVPVDDASYAVNQQAEQIIFEVEEDHIVAHVLIQYAGDPESFAWLVPVPSVPELALSTASAFGLLDTVTAPTLNVVEDNRCPSPAYTCTYHGYPTGCEWPPDPWDSADAGAASDAAAGPNGPGEVEVIDRQTIGSYDTVVLAAGDAQAAVDWLQNEGFIVNSTMAPYMQPYADAGMYFVASRLIPGADVSAIRPLRMRYQGTQPMIPLRLTAVATEPHLTVTSYIYGPAHYRPVDQPLVQIDPNDLSRDPSGRLNYPMVLAHTIDQAGGDGFVLEYTGNPALPDFDQGTGCCDSDWDRCNIAYDGVCSCPGDPNDMFDCGDQTELLEGVALLEQLAQQHPRLTRITTRLSAPEMTFDPMFEPIPGSPPLAGRLSLTNWTERLRGCESDIIEADRYQDILDRQACAAVYCGPGAECATTATGPGCVCPASTVARTFTDLDGETSVTCVPDQAPVDYEAGGQIVPDACLGVACGQGTCVDVGGFPTCRCDAGAAATQVPGARAPTCRAVEQSTGTPGAQDYSDEVSQVRVCAPPPPTSCGEYGWLEENPNPYIAGELCPSSQPDPDLLRKPRAPTCEDYGARTPGCGCQSSNPGSLALLFFLLALAWVARTRRSRARTA